LDIAQYCYDTYATGWATTPGNMTNCATGTYGESSTDAELQELTAHTLEFGCGGSGTITKVEVRYWGSRHNGPGSGTNNRASVTPVFGGTTDGDLHDPGTVLTGASSPISWIDITSDTNAPGTWTWSDVTNLDMDVIAIRTGGKLRVYKVELRVTYTP
jgi:hypothetical protein